MFPTIDKKETGIRLKKLMEQRGITAKDIRQYLHLGSVQSVYHWLNGECLPSVDNLYALSQLFQVPVDDMLCGSRQLENTQEKLQLKTVHVEQQFRRLHAYYTKLEELCAA